MKFTFGPESRPLDGFTIKRAIHRGGFGEVYYALSDSGKEVALKLLKDNQEVELRGIQQCLNLKHPNLVTIFDIKTDSDDDYWIVMEYVGGKTLSEVIASQPNGMPMEEVLHWLRGISDGIEFLHSRGLVHRDLKPGNVFSESNIVKVGDVGLSKFIAPSKKSAHTQSVGTVYYMAPEVARGRYGKEVDVYAMGIIVHEMLTGQVPFEGESAGEILMKHLTERPDLLRVPERLRPVLAKALEKDPEKRISTIQEFAKQFEAAVMGNPLPEQTTSEQPTLKQPTSKPSASKQKPKRKTAALVENRQRRQKEFQRREQHRLLKHLTPDSIRHVPWMTRVCSAVESSLLAIPIAFGIVLLMGIFGMKLQEVSSYSSIRLLPGIMFHTIALSLAAASIITTVKLTEGEFTSWIKKRLILAAVGILIGIMVEMLSHYLNINGASRFGSEIPAEGVSAVGYPFYFFVLFLVINWNWRADSVRKKRFSFSKLFVTWIVMVITLGIIDGASSPSLPGLFWAIALCVTVQLASSWMNKQQRIQLIKLDKPSTAW